MPHVDQESTVLNMIRIMDNRTQDNSYTGQLVPRTTRTQNISYPWQLMPVWLSDVKQANTIIDMCLYWLYDKNVRNKHY